MRNYFRMKEVCIFFDDESIIDTTRAYKEACDSAKALECRAVLFRPCMLEGPWNNLPLVGHRERNEITADILAAGSNVEECIARSLELTALDSRFALGLEAP